MAAGAIQMGAGEVFVCAGVESMSRVPMGGFNPMPNPTLAANTAAYVSMGQTAENLARRYQITRADQQQMAVDSHRKAAAAQAQGRLADEIVPIAGVAQDGTIRPETSQDALSGLKPAFDAEGTVTAGTSSPLTDGAAALLVTTEDYARAHGLPILAKIRSIAVAGCDAEVMGIGPVPATQKALKRAGLSAGDIDVVELNEAFAAQALACVHDLGLAMERINLEKSAMYRLAESRSFCEIK
jgi:acetyl-CoA acetyltransferase family protein